MERDGHIRLLPLHVANKIAAGEVVERPASVLKELLENAIDAGSTRIEANIVSGGRKLVSVRDDGCGMTREDSLLSLERQATSKIRDVDDIEKIDTLGFRGEAIPSIASVSRFTITTRRHDDEGGTRLTVNAGILAEVKDCGAPPGTCIEVRDLFCNVPARRKFLRAYATEEAHIRATFTLNALAHPDVGFTLILDGRETYRLPPGATLEERIRDIFGAPFAESLVPVSTPDPAPRGINVHGYVEMPNKGPSIRRDQFVFINGRPASASVITYALREAYPRTREEVRPAIVLFIDLPPTQVDVNVHPAKREVRFRTPSDVREAIISAVSVALKLNSEPVVGDRSLVNGDRSLVNGERSLVNGDRALVNGGEIRQSPATNRESPNFAIPFSTPVQPDLPARADTCDPSPNTQLPTPNTQLLTPNIQLPTPNTPNPSPNTQLPTPNTQYPTPNTQHLTPNTQRPTPSTTLWRYFNFLAQTLTGFLLLETDAGLVTVDPKAARERIAYEKILDRTVTASQQLLIPETVQLPPGDSARIRNFLSEIQAAGFVIEEFGRDTWKIDAVPQLISGIDTSALLASMAKDIAELGVKRGSARWRDELIAKGVSSSYAGAATKLTPEAAVQLINELSTTRMPYVTPRGKVVMIFTSNAELNRKFGR